MGLKRIIRPKLDGTLPRIRRLLKDGFPLFTVNDARKAARHCRDTMKAYASLGNADLDSLREEELKMKGHRRVFDSVTGMFVMSAGLQQTTTQKKYALRTERRRLNALAKAVYDKRKESEWKRFTRRVAADYASPVVKSERRDDSRKRKACMILKQDNKPESQVNSQTLKWAKDVLEINDSN